MNMRSKFRFNFSDKFPKTFWFKFEADANADCSLKYRANDEFKRWSKKHRIPKVILKPRAPYGFYDKYKHV